MLGLEPYVYERMVRGWRVGVRYPLGVDIFDDLQSDHKAIDSTEEVILTGSLGCQT